MKILSVTAQKPDSTGSGVYLTELVKAFAKMGHQQAVLAGIVAFDHVVLPKEVKFYPVFYKTKELSFPVCGMSDEMPYESTRYCDMTEEMTQQFADVFLQKVKTVVEKFEPDIILCHHLYYLTSLIREAYPQLKVYGFSHGSDLRQIKKNTWQRAYIREQIPKLDGIFALHKAQKETICEYFECDEEKVKVIGTGYNRNVFSRVAREKEASDTLKLIFAGKISEKKGVKSLIKAMNHLAEREQKVELLLAGGYGDEQEYGEIVELAENCPCEVQFLGKLSQTDLAKKINESDIFVLPSFYEGLPLVIIEAMACGANVVCTDLPGIQDWIMEALPANEVVFVTPPQMQNEDEPLPESLPEFEKRLAEAILQAKEKDVVSTTEIEKLSWDGLYDRLVQMGIVEKLEYKEPDMVLEEKTPESLREVGKAYYYYDGGDKKKETLGVDLLLDAYVKNDLEAAYIVARLMLRGRVKPSQGDREDFALGIMQRAANRGYRKARVFLDDYCAQRYKEKIGARLKRGEKREGLVDFDGKPIRINRKGRLSPIHAVLECREGKNVLSLNANVSFWYVDEDVSDPELFEEAVLDGILKWQGEYTVFGGQKVQVDVNITTEQKFFGSVYVIPMTEELSSEFQTVANVVGTKKNKSRIRKILTDKRSFATLGLRWSVNSKKCICIQSEDDMFEDYDEITHVAKHEFGHTLGLGDLYYSSSDGLNGVKKGTYAELDCYATGEKNYNLVMCDHHGPISNNDVEMVILAFRENRIQLYQPFGLWKKISKALGKGN